MKAPVVGILIVALSGSVRTQEGKEDEAFTLQSRFLTGDQFLSEQNEKMEMNLTMDVPFGEKPQKVKSTTEEDSEEAFTSEVLDVTEKNLVRKERREYTKSRSTTKTSTDFGESDGEAKPSTRTSPLEGQAFEIVSEGDATKVTPKGDAKEVPKEEWEKLEVFDGVNKLLPEKPVRKGDSWSVSGEKLAEHFGKGAGAAELGKVEGTVDCTLQSVSVVDNRRLARVNVRFDLDLKMDPSKAASGDEADDSDPKRKMKIDLTIKIKNGRGHYLFDVDAGIPVSAEVQADMDIEMTQEIGEMEVSGKGKGKLEFKKQWTLKERKKE